MNSCSTPQHKKSAPQKNGNSCGTPSSSNGCGSSKPSNGCGSSAPANGCSTPSNTPKPKPNTANPLELHACMGLNACKGHDRYGDNSCAGMGYCATVTHTCHSLNNCRGQGGCGLYGDGKQQNHPGDNPCAWIGSCATPINSERFSTVGKNKNKSVWQRARQLFEDRMDQTGRQYGPSPFTEGPPAWWLHAAGSFTACGASGMSGGGSCS